MKYSRFCLILRHTKISMIDHHKQNDVMICTGVVPVLQHIPVPIPSFKRGKLSKVRVTTVKGAMQRRGTLLEAHTVLVHVQRGTGDWRSPPLTRNLTATLLPQIVTPNPLRILVAQNSLSPLHLCERKSLDVYLHAGTVYSYCIRSYNSIPIRVCVMRYIFTVDYQLWNAARRGDCEAIKKALRSRASLQYRNKDLENSPGPANALHMAANGATCPPSSSC